MSDRSGSITERKNDHIKISKYLNIPMISSIFFGLLLLFSNFYTIVNLEVDYRYEDSIIDCIFYIQENVPSNSNIGINKFGETDFFQSHSPEALLFNYNLRYFSSESNLTFNEFTNFTILNAISLFVIKLSDYDVGFNEDFQNATYTKLAGGINGKMFQLYET